MQVRIHGAGVVLDDLDRIRRGIASEETALQIAAHIRARIIGRLDRGVDYQNKPFEPYSSRHAIFRKKMGRPTRKVDLTLTGRMRAAMQLGATSRGARVYFAGGEAARKAMGHDTGHGRLPQRAFFRPADDDLEGVEDILRKHVDGVLGIGR